MHAQAWVIYGMRAHGFRSTDDAATWRASSLQAPVPSFGHAMLADGRLLIVGQGGIVQASSDRGASFQVVSAGGIASLTGLVPLADDRWIVATDQGIRIINVKAPPGATVTAPGGRT